MENREQLLSFVNDLHKEVYSFRKADRYHDFSLDQLIVENEKLAKLYDRKAQEKKRIQEINYQTLKSDLAKWVKLGAKDFKQALKWDMESENLILEGDFDYYCYEKNISYKKSKVLKRLAS